MADRLLTTAERVVWAACFALAAAMIVLIGFTSSDADSALYAGIADRLSQEPAGRWIAPEWWGFWPEAQMTGLFREHPAGIFIMPAALSLTGIPAAQGAYVIGIAAGLGSLVLMAGLVRRLSSKSDGRAALVLLQLMPVAFIFRVRANHEYPMLLCLLVALTGLAWIAERRPLALGALAVAAGLVGGLLIKGVFVVLILIAIAAWILLNPPAAPGVRTRYLAAALTGIAAMIAAAVAYDAWYVRATGETFWAAYWQRQLGPLTIVTPIEGAATLAGHVLFYLSRVIWHPAPWSAALIVGAWRSRSRLRDWFRATSDPARRGLQFVVVFAGLAILVLSPSSRFAERYAFSATFAVACAGVVASLSMWPRLQPAIAAADRRIPCFPAVLWLLLFVLRLGIGPLLPRVD